MLRATVVLYTSCYGLLLIFTVGIAVVDGRQLVMGNVLTDSLYVNNGMPNERIAHCLTGLGPTSTSSNANSALGGLYFKGIMITSDEVATCNSVSSILVTPASGIAGVINIDQCGGFSTNSEGVYTCAMMNSAMMNQSVRFGIYLSGRSE